MLQVWAIHIVVVEKNFNKFINYEAIFWQTYNLDLTFDRLPSQKQMILGKYASSCILLIQNCKGYEIYSRIFHYKKIEGLYGATQYYLYEVNNQ